MKHAFTIYNASAGSGKTFTLVKAYLSILLKNPSLYAYKNILAITFTNKAVAEMKSRIVGALHAFASGDTSKKTEDLRRDLIAETKMEAHEIEQKSKRILKVLIHDYASFDVSTIDKFTHRIIRSFAFDLELSPLFEVNLDTDELLLEAAEQLLTQTGNNAELTQVLLEFALEKTDNDTSWDISNDLVAKGNLLLNENGKKNIKAFKTISLPEFILIRQKLSKKQKQLNEEAIEWAQKALALIDDANISHNSFFRGSVPKFFSGMAAGQFPSSFPAKYLSGESPFYAKITPPSDKLAIEHLAPTLLEIVEAIQKNKGLAIVTTELLNNITPISLLNSLEGVMQELQKEKNILNISEFNSIINAQIKNQPAPFIYERIGERYRHFFIDEFQDTSEMQWENLIPLIDNALSSESPSGERGSLLLVGDPKQSIYRWRGGHPEQFINLSNTENPFVVKDKHTEPLDKNYRSYSEIIQFNNHFFTKMAAYFSNQEYADLYLKTASQICNNKKGGYVSIDFLEEKSPDEAYCDLVLEKIQSALKQGFNYSDIALLTRNRNHGTVLAKFLTEKEIPVISSESLLLANANEVAFLISFLEFLSDSKQLLSKAQCLYYIARYTLKMSAPHDFIKTGLGYKSISDFEKWLDSFRLTCSFKKLWNVSLFEMVQILVNTFVLREKQNAYVTYFLDVILDFDLKKQGSLIEFLDFWKKKKEKLSIPMLDGGNAIQITTIHKSKGLEYRVVIVPFIKSQIHKSDLLWIDADENQLGLPKWFIKSKQELTNVAGLVSENYIKKIEEGLLDALNVWYVAFTRAEEQLYLICENSKNINTNPINNNRTFVQLFCKSFSVDSELKNHYEWGTPVKVSLEERKKTESTGIEKPVQYFNLNAIKIAQREAILWESKQGDAIAYGTLLHKIAAYIYTADDLTKALSIALQNGWITHPQQPHFKELFTNLLQEKTLAPYFDKNHIVFNERSLLLPKKGSVKPDKMVIDLNQNVYLLDYKTGNPEPKHHQQINAYADALTASGYCVIEKKLVYLSDTLHVIAV
jgi:ATP-dependent exoDNAse (exonuclease V) beta subunit